MIEQSQAVWESPDQVTNQLDASCSALHSRQHIKSVPGIMTYAELLIWCVVLWFRLCQLWIEIFTLL